MLKPTKFRPTFTRMELNAIIQACTDSLRARVQAGDFDSPLVKHLAEVKKYTERFIANIDDPLDNKTGRGQAQVMEPSIADKLRALGLDESYLSSGDSQAAFYSQQMPTTLAGSEPSQYYNSPLDNPELSEEQVYDALLLKDQSIYTSAETEFFLNKGTIIRMKREAAKIKQVSTDDL